MRDSVSGQKRAGEAFGDVPEWCGDRRRGGRWYRALDRPPGSGLRTGIGKGSSYRRDLFFTVRSPTLPCSNAPDQADRNMSDLEFFFYFLFGPLGMFATGLIVYYFAMRQPREDQPPAE